MDSSNAASNPNETGQSVPRMSLPPKRSAELDAVFDHSLVTAGSRLDERGTFPPFLVESHDGIEQLLGIIESSSSDHERAVEELRELPIEASLKGYAIVSDGDIVLEGERVRAIVLEGGDRASGQGQRWAVPYTRDPETNRATPQGLYHIEQCQSRFTIRPSRGEESKRKLPFCATTENVAKYPLFVAHARRYSDLIKRFTGPRGSFSLGISIAELIPTLRGAKVPVDVQRFVAGTLDFMRSHGADRSPHVARVSYNLTPHKHKRTPFFPDLILACAERGSHLATDNQEALLLIDPVNFSVRPLGSEQSLLVTSTGTEVTSLAEGGLTAGKILFLAHPPEHAGVPMYRWFVGLYRELAVALIFDLLSFWLEAHCAYSSIADTRSIPASERYTDPLFTSSVRHSGVRAEIDSGLYELVINGTRIAAETEICKFLGPEAYQLGLVDSINELEGTEASPQERFIDFEHMPLVTRYGATVSNIPQVVEELIEYLRASITACVDAAAELSPVE